MARPGSVDKLAPEIRDAIGRLRDEGATIDQIVAHLRGLSVVISRSAMGRHIRGLEALGERLRRSRSVAEVLVRQLGDAPASRSAQMNIELLHTAVLDLFMKSADGEEVDARGEAAVAGNPEGVMMLAKALDHLTRASKSDVEFVAKIEARVAERTKKEAADAVDLVVREKGITAETAAAIKARIFGVRAAA
jgi:hypothetical protein